MVSLCWFRRDLRLADNPALTAAAAEGPVLTVFLDEPLLRAQGAATRWRLGRAAEALDTRGRSPDALALLAPFINFTGHEEGGPLPCLCKTCIATAPLRAETAGVAFTRSFAISGTRVVHYWLIEELEEQRTEVKRSVGEALKNKLKRKRRRKPT